MDGKGCRDVFVVPIAYMGVEPKIGVFTPQIIHLFIRFSIIFTIHFGGTPLFLETPIYSNLSDRCFKDSKCSSLVREMSECTVFFLNLGSNSKPILYKT